MCAQKHAKLCSGWTNYIMKFLSALAVSDNLLNKTCFKLSYQYFILQTLYANWFSA